MGTIGLSIQLQHNEAQSLCSVLWVHKISQKKKGKKKSIRQWQLKMKIFMCVSNSSVKHQCFLRLNKPKEVYWARVEALERVKGLRQLTGEGKGRMTDRYKRVRERERECVSDEYSQGRGKAPLLTAAGRSLQIWGAEQAGSQTLTQGESYSKCLK